MNTPDRFTAYALQTSAGQEVNNLRAWLDIQRDGKVHGFLWLTDEQALSLLENGWRGRPRIGTDKLIKELTA